ncbi:MFS transporter [Marinobacter fonticola]|uniref:MFS transporter n=1 Tax=Marinobacter fonticola TaxID=2603215 RepID=UPI0011E77768|nr:MFS transporter [Marinobacter fonticola]
MTSAQSVGVASQRDVTAIREDVRHTSWASVVALALATLVIASELTLSAFALPLISSDLGIRSTATAWVLLAYTVPLVALAIPAGRWADQADTRLVFLVSLLAVGLTSLISAWAPSFELLMLGRVLQGLAAALYLTVYMPVISQTVRAAERGRAISIVATIMMLGSVGLAPLGGFVADLWGWRAVFLVKMPLLLVVLLLGYRVLPPADAHASKPLLPLPTWGMLRDTLLIGSAMTALMLVLEGSSGFGATSLGLLMYAGLAVGVWCRLRTSQPVVRLLKHRSFGLAALALTLVAGIIGLMSFSLPFFVNDVLGQGPETLSYAMLGFVSIAALISPVAGTLADRFGAATIATVGAALTTLGVLTMATLDADATVIELVLTSAATGAGMAVFNAPVMAAMLQASPAGQMGTSSGLAGVARMLGSTIGPAIAALAWHLAGGGVAGLHAGVYALAGLVFLGFVAMLFARRTPSPG